MHDEFISRSDERRAELRVRLAKGGNFGFVHDEKRRRECVSLRGVRTEGAMSPEISLDRQRPAQYVFSKHVEHKLDEIRKANKKPELLGTG